MPLSGFLAGFGFLSSGCSGRIWCLCSSPSLRFSAECAWRGWITLAKFDTSNTTGPDWSAWRRRLMKTAEKKDAEVARLKRELARTDVEIREENQRLRETKAAAKKAAEKEVGALKTRIRIMNDTIRNLNAQIGNLRSRRW